MTNEEAIELLKREFSECRDTISVYADKRKKAFEMAIQALQKKPCECKQVDIDKFKEILQNNPPIISVLEEVSVFEEEPQEDCISRRDVIEIIESAYEECKIGYTDYAVMRDAVKDMLSVKPQRAKGHLISNQQDGEVKAFWERYRCSVCGEYAQDNFNYCSRCGAELEGEEE